MYWCVNGACSDAVSSPSEQQQPQAVANGDQQYSPTRPGMCKGFDIVPHLKRWALFAAQTAAQFDCVAIALHGSAQRIVF